jgi:hypothetical protein
MEQRETFRPWMRGLLAVALLAFTAGILWRQGRFGHPAPTLPDAHEALIRHRHEGLDALIARAEAGPIVPAGQHVLVGVDQKLVQSLLGALAPADYVISGSYRIHVERAVVSFEDGFALVRLEGRASLLGREDDVFADVTVLGDLHVESEQQHADVLQTRIQLLAVDARKAAVMVESKAAEDLAEELGRQRLEAFAAMGSELEIPVRQSYQLEVPAAGPGGPVRIDAATIPVQLTVVDVTAFAGRLWVTMAAAVGPGAVAPATPPVPLVRPSPLLPAQMAQQHREQHERLEVLLARDPLMAQAMRAEGDVVIVARSEFARAVIRQVAHSYFDRVVIDLRPRRLPAGRERRPRWAGCAWGSGRWTCTSIACGACCARANRRWSSARGTASGSRSRCTWRRARAAPRWTSRTTAKGWRAWCARTSRPCRRCRAA